MMTTKRSTLSRLALALLLVALTAAGCGGDRAPREGERLRVVASFYPLAAAARQAGGTAVAVSDMTPAGVEPHDLELRPSDVAAISNADLVVYLGGGFQPAVEDAVRTLPEGRRLDVLAALGLANADDPHIWLDPVLMKQAVAAIGEALVRVAPAARETVERGVTAYGRILDTLDTDYREALAPCRGAALVVPHAAFGYLAERYGLEQVAITGTSPEAEPSPRRLEEVVALVRERGVPTVFATPLEGERLARSVARAAGAEVAVLHTVENLTPDDRAAGADYVSLMSDNLRALVAGLRCEAT